MSVAQQVTQPTISPIDHDFRTSTAISFLRTFVREMKRSTNHFKSGYKFGCESFTITIITSNKTSIKQKRYDHYIAQIENHGWIANTITTDDHTIVVTLTLDPNYPLQEWTEFVRLETSQKILAVRKRIEDQVQNLHDKYHLNGSAFTISFNALNLYDMQEAKYQLERYEQVVKEHHHYLRLLKKFPSVEITEHYLRYGYLVELSGAVAQHLSSDYGRNDGYFMDLQKTISWCIRCWISPTVRFQY